MLKLRKSAKKEMNALVKKPPKLREKKPNGDCLYSRIK